MADLQPTIQELLSRLEKLEKTLSEAPKKEEAPLTAPAPEKKAEVPSAAPEAPKKRKGLFADFLDIEW